jgi:anti-anti-sigma regulatory factor
MNSALPTSAIAASTSGPGETVTVDGPLTVAAAEEWRVRLAAALGRGSGLTVDVSAAKEVDVFGVQLLWAARRSAREQGRTFGVIDGSGSLRRACASAGLDPAVF